MWLSAVSSIAVIAGAFFVIFQLRQNAKLIEATMLTNKSNTAVSLLEKLTDESFPRRRKNMHDVIKKASQNNWVGFDDSLDDFEVRNFAYSYELIGQLVREKVIDLATIRNALQNLVVIDWEAFSPLSAHLMQRFNIKVNPWQNFEWLASETRKYMQERERGGR
jgi:hypothetical protein